MLVYLFWRTFATSLKKEETIKLKYFHFVLLIRQRMTIKMRFDDHPV